MEIKINGRMHKAEVVLNPRGVYCCKDGYDFPSFPLSVAVCEVPGCVYVNDRDFLERYDVLFVPMFECSDGYEMDWANTLRNEVDGVLLKRFAEWEMRQEPGRSLKDVVSGLLTDFRAHGVALTQSALDFAEEAVGVKS